MIEVAKTETIMRDGVPHCYKPVVDGVEQNHVCDNPNFALLLGLQIKHEGMNGHFANYASRMLGIGRNFNESDIRVVAIDNVGKNRITSIKGDKYFVPVVDGNECSHAAENEDIALLLGLQFKHDGLNSQFVRFACRMLGIPSNWAE